MLSKLCLSCLFLASLLLVGLPGVVAAASPAQDSFTAYEADIDRSCQRDSDCAVKDVHNCCGYYPECVNAAAKTDAERVRKLCADAAMGSICGFPDISSCVCSQGACRPSSNEPNTPPSHAP